MKTSIFMSFVREYDDKNLNDAVFYYRNVPTEKRYLDVDLKLSNKRFVQNPKDNTKFAVVADYVSVEPEATAESCEQ